MGRTDVQMAAAFSNRGDKWWESGDSTTTTDDFWEEVEYSVLLGPNGIAICESPETKACFQKRDNLKFFGSETRQG